MDTWTGGTRNERMNIPRKVQSIKKGEKDMEEQKRNIFTGNIQNAGSASGGHQDQHLQRMDLPEERREQNVFAGGKISTVPGSEASQDPCALRSQSQINIEDVDGIGSCGAGILSDAMLQTLLRSEFYRDLCVQPIDCERFDAKYRWKDHLLLIPGMWVSGKGLEHELGSCLVYLKKGMDRYTFGLGEDNENKDIFYKIPKGIAFDIVGKGKKIYIIIPNDIKEWLIYKLPDDVNVDIYFETKLYKGEQNVFYGHVSRELRYKFNLCNITADPRLGETFFMFFAKTIDLEDHREGPQL